MLFDPGACCSCASSPVCVIKFRVLGCNNQPIQGALVRVYDQAALVNETGNGHTDANGEVSINASKSGSNYYKVAPPEAGYATRFNAITNGTAIHFPCAANPTGFNPVQLTAKTGYFCCDVGGLKPPWPIPRDAELVTKYSVDPIQLSPTHQSGPQGSAGCGLSTSLKHLAPDVSAHDRPPPFECPLDNSGGGSLPPPPDIGLQACWINYRGGIGGANAFMSEETHLGNDGQILNYCDPKCWPWDGVTHPPFNTPCPSPVSRAWRFATAVSHPNGFFSESFEVASIYPLKVIFSMASGPGFGPWPTSAIPAKIGDSVSKTIIVREVGYPEDEEPDSAPPAYPSLAKQAANVLGSAARFVASGGATVDQAEFDRRRSICQACPTRRYVAAEDRCQACGCYLSIKPWGKAEACPDGHW